KHQRLLVLVHSRCTHRIHSGLLLRSIVHSLVAIDQGRMAVSLICSSHSRLSAPDRPPRTGLPASVAYPNRSNRTPGHQRPRSVDFGFKTTPRDTTSGLDKDVALWVHEQRGRSRVARNIWQQVKNS